MQKHFLLLATLAVLLIYTASMALAAPNMISVELRADKEFYVKGTDTQITLFVTVTKKDGKTLQSETVTLSQQKINGPTFKPITLTAPNNGTSYTYTFPAQTVQIIGLESGLYKFMASTQKLFGETMTNDNTASIIVEVAENKQAALEIPSIAVLLISLAVISLIRIMGQK